MVERPLLLPLPQVRFDSAYREPRRVDPAIPLISWRGVRYSVPTRVLGQTVEVHQPVDSSQFTVRWAGQTIATHTQAPSGSDDVWDPTHHADAVHAALSAATGRHLHPVPPPPPEPAADERLAIGEGYDVAVPDLAVYGDGCNGADDDIQGRLHRPAGDLMNAGVYEQLKDDLGYLQLGHAAETFATLAETARNEDWSHLQFLAELIGGQATATRDRRMAARLRYARFPFRRTIDEFDFEFQPSVDRKLVDDLATLRFVDDGRPILFLGQPGCGKTHLAVALAIRVVEAGWRGYFTTADDMTRTLVRAQIEGTWTAKLKTYTAPTVLVIDDVGLLPMADRDAAGAFFHVVNTRYEKKHPTIVTTNRGLPDWGQIFGDPVVAAAILDRLMHNAVVFNIKRAQPTVAESQLM